MPSPGFRRSLPLLDLSPAESTQVRIDPERELAAKQLASEAAKAGALGAPVAGNLGRSMVSYEDWLSDIKSRPVIFRGLRGDVSDPLAPLADSRFLAAYGTPNPAVAATYATPTQADVVEPEDWNYSPRNRPFRGPGGSPLTMAHIAEGGDIYPMRPSSQGIRRVSRKGLEELSESLDNERMAKYAKMLDIINDAESNTYEERLAAQEAINLLHRESDLNTLASRTPKGRLLAVSDLVDTWAEFPPLDPSHLSNLPSDVYSWTDPSAVELSGKPFKASETPELLRSAAKRLGYPEEGLHRQSMSQAKDALSGWWESPYSYVRKDLPYIDRKTEYTDKAQRLMDEVQNDPRFLPTRKARAAQFLKGMAKEALKPKNIITDALIGSQVGAASALAGYEAGQPRAAGVFNLPGEYRQALSQEDLLAQIEAKAAQKEALRQQYIDEVNATYGEGTLQPGARIEEIRDYLGPVRGLQGR
jgi:predicted nucleic acid-binding protein